MFATVEDCVVGREILSARTFFRYRDRCRAWLAPVGKYLAQAFPERQILVRELDRMSIYRLSRRLQALLVGIGILMSGGTIAVVIGVVAGVPNARPREVSAIIAANIEDDRAPARDSVERAGIRADIATVGGEPRIKATPSAQAAGDVDDAEAGDPPVALAETFAPPGVVAPAPALERSVPNERLKEKLAAIDDRVFTLATRGLGAPPPAEGARATQLGAANGSSETFARVARIERHVERLASGVSALRDSETALVRDIQPQLAFFISTAERAIERAGLDIDELSHAGFERKQIAEGGPFVAAGVGGPLAAERAALQADLAYWQSLRGIVRRMPLAAPLERYAISSSFGRRRDPLNSRKAVHNGLDLIAPLGSPVKATAPGTVVFAGRNGGYGNFIEIDHGQSLRTRFAHLRAIKVKKGDKVRFLQTIGILGNTGRSTGPHLHYEVLVADKPVNPINFIKAGQYVFQE